MRHAALFLANVEIEQAQRQARARAEQRASSARSGRGQAGGLFKRLRGR
jgi:hypothetical protein